MGIEWTPLLGLSIRAPHAHGIRVRLKTLDVSQHFHGLADLFQPFAGKFLHGHKLYEIHYAEAAAETSLPCGRQNMVWSGRIVACRLRRVFTHEHRTGIPDVGNIFPSNGNVFGCDGVCPLTSLLARSRNEASSLSL